MRCEEYVRPKSIEKAYELLNTNKNSAILGGGMFLRLSPKNYKLLIDVCDLGLKYINEGKDYIEIGSMTTFADMEKSEIIKKLSNGVLIHSIRDIVGKQMRNMVTVGGTVNGRYGFSEFLTALLCLDTKVILHKSGEMPLGNYLSKKDNKQKDIIEKILVNKESRRAKFLTLKNSYGDFPILCVAVSKNKGDFKISVGARPGVASLAVKTEEYLKSRELNERVIDEAIKLIPLELVFGSDYRASKGYREEVGKVLVRRCLMEVCK